MRERISPCRFLLTASGLMIAKVRSINTNESSQKPHKLAGLKPSLYKIKGRPPQTRVTPWDFFIMTERATSAQAEACATKTYFRAVATVEPSSAGVSTVGMPAAAIAGYLSLAVPCHP